MDVKELNKSQLILLAILISFVTSIATGIVTVTLLQQAPVSVKEPINRVVQQTVEKIVQIEGKSTTQTVVIKEEDLIVDAIAKNESAVFVISKDGFDENGNSIEISLGRGFVVSNSDIVVVDANFVFGKDNYFVKNNSGKFKAEFISSDIKGFSLLKIGAPLDEKNKLAYTLPSFGDLSKMKAGRKILIRGNVISSFIYEGSKDIKIAKGNGGAIVLDLDGNVLGIALNNEINSFVSIEDILNTLNTQKSA